MTATLGYNCVKRIKNPGGCATTPRRVIPLLESAMPPQSTRSCPRCGKQFQTRYRVQHCSRRCEVAARAAKRPSQFWARVNKSGPTVRPELGPCWMWDGGRNRAGYGQFSNTLISSQMAHRYSWTLTYGPIPDALFVLHHCDNPPCVNPGHLFLGTKSDNARDMLSKGRQILQVHPERAARGADNGHYTHPERTPKGERHPLAKITEAQVHQIRELRKQGLFQREVAAALGIKRSMVSDVLNRTWRHLQ